MDYHRRRGEAEAISWRLLSAVHWFLAKDDAVNPRG
jgi:hypothetical protein